VGPFVMLAEGMARLFARDQMREGPFPEHYEPFESPIANDDAATRWMGRAQRNPSRQVIA
jgi:formate dehydrogenase major subunit